MGAFRVVIYGIMASVFVYSLAYDFLYVPRIGHVWWTYKLVALTYTNLVIQTLYYSLCFVCAMLDNRIEKKDRGPHTRHPSAPSYWRNTPLHRFCDFAYYTSAFPVGTATCLLFWVLYSINPALVMPNWAEKIIPRFLNHVTHTAPLFFISVDTLLTCHQAPKRKTGFAIAITMVFFYFSLIYVIRWIHGYWLYPILELLTQPYHIVFFLISCGLFCSLYLAGDVVNSLLWGEAPHASGSAKKNT